MLGLPIAFASPLLLFGLIALPIIWWLLRLTPPKPVEEVFPPTRILKELQKHEEMPARSPWWLTLLRLMMAALVIGALAEPIWNPVEKQQAGEGPVLVVVDNSWASGNNWEGRKKTAEQIILQAQDDGHPVALVFTSHGAKADLTTVLASDALEKLAAQNAEPVPANFNVLADRITKEPAFTVGSIHWLTTGLAGEGADALVKSFEVLQPKTVTVYNADVNGLQAVSKIGNEPNALTAQVSRVATPDPAEGRALAFDIKGRTLSEVNFTFKADEAATTASFNLPVELRNEITRIELAERNTAAGVQLLDERFQRRRIGLITGEKNDLAQPLLSPLYYISRALQPFSELRRPENANIETAVPALIEQRVSTLVLADIGTMSDETIERLEGWIEKGGSLVRFAGPRLAASSDDALTPVKLRKGGRSLGGSLSWDTPQPLADFSQNSPFIGLKVPDDVTVSRQVLAEPDVDLIEKTWATLADGTPLVTATKLGEGWLILFHVTADATWSNLSLSGTFVDMLRRIVAVSRSAPDGNQGINTNATNSQTGEATLPPLRVLDASGQLTQPASSIKPLVMKPNTKNDINPENPPGIYGSNDAFVAANLFEDDVDLQPFNVENLPANTSVRSYVSEAPTLLKPWLLALAFALLLLDCLAVLWMGGAFRRRANPSFAAFIFAGAVLLLTPDISLAQQTTKDTSLPTHIKAALTTRLAYVVTGNSRIDNISERGMIGVTQFIKTRTSLEPGEPIGVDIETDELTFFPLIYWPIDPDADIPSATTMARIDAFMKQGGSVLFDTRDALSGGFGNSTTLTTERLRDILADLDIPPLEPVPADHVLTKAFYLLDRFPGLYSEGELWVEALPTRSEVGERPARAGDGVSSIMITANDFAGAWATDESGAPMLPTVPNDPNQRIYAYRTGVNLIMYALTGNYKADQVHIPALLERLGQ